MPNDPVVASTVMQALDPSGFVKNIQVDGSGNVKTSGGGGGGGGAATIADGADVAEGTTTDVAVVTDANGTVSGKLRGLVKLFADVWDSVNHRLKVDGSGVTQPVSGTFFQATQPVSGTVTATGTVTANLQPVTSGGSTPYRNLDLGTTGQVVKASVGQLYNYYIANAASSVRYVKFYDKATAPTTGDTPIWTLPIPAFGAANVAFPNGIAFVAGISLRASTGVADADTGAPTANDVVVNLGYK